MALSCLVVAFTCDDRTRSKDDPVRSCFDAGLSRHETAFTFFAAKPGGKSTGFSHLEMAVIRLDRSLLRDQASQGAISASTS